MGQQQLLLIILGVIVVGIAVLLGIYVFQASSVENKRDVVINESVNIASLALQYYKKAKVFGGGQYSFDGWDIPDNLKITNNGQYNAQVYDDSVIITGVGNEYVTSGTPIEIKTTVSKSGINTVIIN